MNLQPVLDVHCDPDQPLLFFGGPYGNLQATEAMIERAGLLGLTPKQVFCSGDTVAYCANPDETVSRLRAWGCHVLMGNCEESLAEGSSDCGCGFEEGTRCDTMAPQWFRYCTTQVSLQNREWMGHLPRRIQIHYGHRKIMLVHGSGTRINQFVFESTSWSQKIEQFSTLNCNLIIGGHAGLPFIQARDQYLWVNAGTLGIPANDGTREVWYLLVEPEGQGSLHLSLNRLAYDWRTAQKSMLDAGLTHYASSLETGLWPSLDILPTSERERTGQPLPHAISYRF